jgi:hypothetical protein
MVRLDRTIGVITRGESDFGHTDGPVEPDHDDSGTVPFNPRHYFSASGARPGDLSRHGAGMDHRVVAERRRGQSI